MATQIAALGPVRTVDARPAGGTERVRLAYHDRGAGDPLVFVHGFAANADLWSLVVPGLVDRWRCLAVDWPMGGHRHPVPAGTPLGLEGQADLVEAFLEALDLQRVTLVGDDSGGAVTQLVLARGSSRVVRAVLTDCDAFDNVPPPPFRPLQVLARLPGATWLLAQALRLRALQRLPFTYGWLTRAPIPPAVMESFLRPLWAFAGTRRDARAMLLGLRPAPVLAAVARLGRFTAPVLIVWGEADKIFPVAHAQRLADAFPDARVALVPEALALLPLDAPEALTRELCAFLGNSGPGSGDP